MTMYEMGSQVGGLWVYENDNGRSAAYRSLRINSEARVTGYRDFPIPETASLYPSHTEIREYLNAYADQFGLREHIKFVSEVTSVEQGQNPDGTVGWTIGFASGSRSVKYDRIVIANGHQAMPVHPSFASSFSGEYLHSRDYRVPEKFAGKRVLVVGTGNSALDIAADVCSGAFTTAIVARSPMLIMPRMIFGIPLARVLAKVEKPWLPWPVARRIRELLSTIVSGRMEKWGLVTPTIRTHPASHPTVMAQIAWDKIRVRPGIAEVDGRNIRFVDGTVEEFDVVIAATGYEFDIPFLHDNLSPVVDGRINLYRRVVHPDLPSLNFVGLFDVSGGANIRMMDIQSRWLGALVDNEISLPTHDRMLRAIAAEHERLSELYPHKLRYGLELDPREYGLAIREDLRATTVPPKKQSASAPTSKNHR